LDLHQWPVEEKSIYKYARRYDGSFPTLADHTIKLFLSPDEEKNVLMKAEVWENLFKWCWDILLGRCCPLGTKLWESSTKYYTLISDKKSPITPQMVAFIVINFLNNYQYWHLRYNLELIHPKIPIQKKPKTYEVPRLKEGETDKGWTLTTVIRKKDCRAVKVIYYHTDEWETKYFSQRESNHPSNRGVHCQYFPQQLPILASRLQFGADPPKNSYLKKPKTYVVPPRRTKVGLLPQSSGRKMGGAVKVIYYHAKEWETKYSKSDAGSSVSGGWTKEGKQLFITWVARVKEARNCHGTHAMEDLLIQAEYPGVDNLVARHSVAQESEADIDWRAAICFDFFGGKEASKSANPEGDEAEKSDNPSADRRIVVTIVVALKKTNFKVMETKMRKF
jgi:hypothetical protein